MVKNPLEEATSGYSDQRSLNFSGLERRAVYRSDLLLASLDETASIDSRVEESRRGKLAT